MQAETLRVALHESAAGWDAVTPEEARDALPVIEAWAADNGMDRHPLGSIALEHWRAVLGRRAAGLSVVREG